MRVVFFGAGEFALPTLEALHASDTTIALVVTQPDRKAGRGQRLAPTPVSTRAAGLSLEVVTCPNVNEPAFIDRLRDLRADVGVVIDFGQKIGQPVRDVFPGGCINLHASLLPLYRGAAPFQWAIIRGEKRTGVTVFKLVDRMDAGPILTTRALDIDPRETAAELHDRLAALGPAAVNDALAIFEGGRMPDGVAQDDSAATKAPRFTKQDSRLDFNDPADTVACRIRGLWPWPGAICRFVSADGSRREDVTLARAVPAPRESIATLPGVLNEQLHAGAAAGAIAILDIKPHSGKLMSWRDFINGRHVRCGDRFVSLD